MNRSLATTVAAALVIVAGYLTPVYRDQLLSVGSFALSGAVTNWLAIHMLFERVPLLYGSGVIPNRFEEFKLAIRSLIMTQFFTAGNLDRFLESRKDALLSNLDVDALVGGVNYGELFEPVVVEIMASPVGRMLAAVGGENALEPLVQSLGSVVTTVASQVARSPSFRRALEDNLAPAQMRDEIRQEIGSIVDQRLNELTPEMVKHIIEEMIEEHLGWLVVWGGVFGGLIGLVMSFVN
jgi:uncharacterized membrane protein YheB (UPF0754 family)